MIFRPLILIALAGSLGAFRSALGDEADAGAKLLFRERIEPVLREKCFACHSGDAKELHGGLKLDSRAASRRGGDTGAAVVPGKPAESLLIKALKHQDGLEMPPKQPKLADASIADFEKWIELGAPDPREEKAAEGWSQAAREHWAFQQVKRHVPPAVADPAWPHNAPDAFILARLDEKQWRPNSPTSRAELLRRLTFDLTGLPPTPDEVQGFGNDTNPDAYERLADRLLESPRFGERWAQHWLDVVRYAETEGYEYDRHVPDAWRYRDYVIAAANRDKPFDEFLREQIAGDELNPQDHAALAATVFFRLGPVRRNAGNPDIALSRNEVLTERTDIIGSAILGLTVGCARCHNHKLEPISQRDYYRFQAYLAATEEHNVSLATAAEQETWEAETKRIKDEMQRLQKIARLKTGEERVKLQEEIETLEDQFPPPLPTIPSTKNDFPKRTPIHVLRRGEWEKKGDAVGPRPLSVLTSTDLAELPADVSDPRTRLANWLTSADQPLTARVIVNRLWQQHFGTGLVKTANDFGTHGERPSHPDLLDWLAAELVANGWRLKSIHRALVTSSTYQQSSNLQSAITNLQSADPDNRLLASFPRRRLSAEELRDAMLAVAGRLNLRSGGASVMTPVDAELVRQLYKPSQWQVPKQAGEFDRRSVFLIAKRNLRLPFMEVFDAPAMQTSCSRREASTHAPQALELLNGQLSNDLAAAFAARLKLECGEDVAKIVERAFWLALGRGPTTAEQVASLEFLKDSPLGEFAIAVFNLNGFAYVP